jgi:hypothetical protein
MPALPRHVIDTGMMRRLIHLGLLVVIVIAVRACGGATVAEDRLSVASRWMAEKTGLTEARDTWNARVRPRVAAVTDSISGGIYRAVTLAIQRTQNAVDAIGAWMAEQAKIGTDAAARAVRSVLTGNGNPEPPATGADAPPSTNPQPAPAP